MKFKATAAISMVAAMALLVPVAGAATRPDDRGGLHGPGGVPQSALAESDQAWMDPAIRSAIQEARSGAVRPDDRAGRREAPVEVPSIAPSGATDSFDWTDAGIGAGAVAAGGLLTLVLAGLLLARHDRRRLGHA